MRVNPLSSLGAGRTLHLEIPGSAGDTGDEVARAKHFKTALDLGVHPRAVNDRVLGAVGLHYIDGERIADDVLG